MILAMLKLQPLRGKKKDILQILSSIQQSLKLKAGCQGSHVYESVQEPESVLYIEYWENTESFHRHVQSDLYLRILTAMELSRETPLIQFHEFTSVPGMELIEGLRERSGNTVY